MHQCCDEQAATNKLLKAAVSSYPGRPLVGQLKSRLRTGECRYDFS